MSCADSTGAKSSQSSEYTHQPARPPPCFTLLPLTRVTGLSKGVHQPCRAAEVGSATDHAPAEVGSATNHAPAVEVPHRQTRRPEGGELLSPSCLASKVPSLPTAPALLCEPPGPSGRAPVTLEKGAGWSEHPESCLRGSSRGERRPGHQRVGADGRTMAAMKRSLPDFLTGSLEHLGSQCQMILSKTSHSRRRGQ